ncbi:thymidine kinase [Microbacterium sp. EYE_5]|uniref:thymidine kinase n=1 Tax=unclassified Microbacterium TaxID=2609290 RepID=UPI0020054698|nr:MULTISPECIES: thymidine kinase [unclassified Microbacterium]MCK6080334.1 thymidine kinase [Microbacterium sp. EYE_382]MCK6085605.1 thymidine kinase [Microbacterium sp. EYE_384]MCK6122170.1 thymidine kinase [Microbacterium sp. EYE_80]MCK6126368.1 thymidine kinase [Microbacterium sp. EYE_79]MCK6141289.1 thymidine kinase [Microbacterium sp. EYE_39]
MAKLYFRYGAMNSGKSTALLQAAYNYEERGQHVLLAKPEIDTKGADQISSRLGVERTVDFLVGRDDDLRARFATHRQRVQLEARAALVPDAREDVACLLVDEAQFLTPEQADDLLRIAVEDGIPVLAYGIRTDFQTRAFPGSARLMELSHSLEELKTICRCGSKALFNARLVGGRFVFDGDQVAIDELTADRVTYESMCARCYLRESGGRLR